MEICHITTILDAFELFHVLIIILIDRTSNYVGLLHLNTKLENIRENNFTIKEFLSE